jgi:hypothetical protein
MVGKDTSMKDDLKTWATLLIIVMTAVVALATVHAEVKYYTESGYNQILLPGSLRQLWQKGDKQ